MARRSATGIVVLTALAIGIGAMASCKEGNPLSSGIAPATAGFEPDAVPSGIADHHVSLRVRSIGGGRIVLDVLVTQVDQPVTGIALKLTYPKTFSRFIGCADGELFPPGGRCFFAETEPGSGEVFIGRSVADPTESTVVEGGKVIVRVEFLTFGKGAGPIVFEGQNLGGGDATALLDAAGEPIFMRWYAGTLMGT